MTATADRLALVGDRVELVEIYEGLELAVSGAIDVRSVGAVRASLQQAIDAGSGDLVLHLADAEIGDATGLGVLVGAHHRCQRRGRRLVIAEASPRLERLLACSRLHKVIARAQTA